MIANDIAFYGLTQERCSINIKEFSVADFTLSAGNIINQNFKTT